MGSPPSLNPPCLRKFAGEGGCFLLARCTYYITKAAYQSRFPSWTPNRSILAKLRPQNRPFRFGGQVRTCCNAGFRLPHCCAYRALVICARVCMYAHAIVYLYTSQARRSAGEVPSEEQLFVFHKTICFGGVHAWLAVWISGVGCIVWKFCRNLMQPLQVSSCEVVYSIIESAAQDTAMLAFASPSGFFIPLRSPPTN